MHSSAHAAAVRATIAAAQQANAHFLASAPPEPTGAPFGVFGDIRGRKVSTGNYVFAIDPSTGKAHFAFGRKIPPGRRVPLGWLKTAAGQAFKQEVRKKGPTAIKGLISKYNAPLDGAAGTDPKYHGKWASLGGGSDKAADTIFEASIIELNDEAAILPRLQTDEVFLPNKGRPFKKTTRMTLVGSDQPNPKSPVYIFVYKMENWNEFIRYFPPVDERTSIRGGYVMAKLSHGEIDYAQSFTVDDMLRFWDPSKANFFTSYTMKTFQTTVMDILEEHEAFLVANRGAGPLGLRAAEVRALVVPRDTGPRVADGWRDQNPPYVL